MNISAVMAPVQISVLHTPSPAVTPTNLLYNLIAIPVRCFASTTRIKAG
jgi:hypothetical protein